MGEEGTDLSRTTVTSTDLIMSKMKLRILQRVRVHMAVAV